MRGKLGFDQPHEKSFSSSASGPHRTRRKRDFVEGWIQVQILLGRDSCNYFVRPMSGTAVVRADALATSSRT